jgi:hypothetical protein
METPKGANKVKIVLVVLLLIGVAAAAMAVGAAALVFGSYGFGKLLLRSLPFSPFEATLVSLLALATTVSVAVKIVSRAVAGLKSAMSVERCEVCGGFHHVEDDDDSSDEDDKEFTPDDGLRAAPFAAGTVKPNAPCPCGSGSRYSKCCGDGRLFRHRREGGRQ